MDRERIERAVRDVLATEGRGIAAVYLFGSVARGTDRPGSDIDLAILYRKPPGPSLAELPLELEAALEARLERPVQVVALHSAPVDLVHRVLRDGHLRPAEPEGAHGGEADVAAVCGACDPASRARAHRGRAPPGALGAYVQRWRRWARAGVTGALDDLVSARGGSRAARRLCGSSCRRATAAAT